MKTPHIRPLTQSDLDGLPAIKDDLSVHTQRFRQQQEGSALYLGAFSDECPAGFVLLSLENKRDVLPYTGQEPCADMIDLLVLPGLRGQGIGTALILACEDACRERGIPWLSLDVNPADNPAAKRLYERLGYRAVGELHLDGVYKYIDEHGASKEYEDWCIDMVKRL